MSELKIYSPYDQPFGVLSNFSRTGLNINGKPYASPMQYIYTNIFNINEYRTHMYNVITDPFVEMNKFMKGYLASIRNAAIEEGMRKRFEIDSKLVNTLLRTGSARFAVKEKRLEKYPALLESIRSEYSSAAKSTVAPTYFYMDAALRSEMTNILNGIAIQVKSNPSFIAPKSYDELKKLAVATNLPLYRFVLSESKENFIENVSRFVESEKSKISIAKFKDHLLDVYLDYILKKEYHNVAAKDYALAKKQAIDAETNIENYKDQLYTFYQSDQIPDEVVKHLQTKPYVYEYDKNYGSVYQKSDILTLSEGDVLRPDYLEDVTLNSVVYRSVMHYVYQKMFAVLEMDTSKVDVVTFKTVESMVKYFKLMYVDYYTLKIIHNNEIAIYEKYKNPALSLLLLNTARYKLIWNDSTDPVLGSTPSVKRHADGPNKLRFGLGGVIELIEAPTPDVSSDAYPPTGINRAGAVMENIRSMIQLNPPYFKDLYIGDDPVYMTWLSNVGAEYMNILQMFKFPNTESMTAIVVQPLVPDIQPMTVSDSNLLSNIGAIDAAKQVIWPLIYSKLIEFIAMPIADAVKYIVDSYNIDTPITPEILDKVKAHLSTTYSLVKSYLFETVTETVFIDTVVYGPSYATPAPRLEPWRLYGLAKNI